MSRGAAAPGSAGAIVRTYRGRAREWGSIGIGALLLPVAAWAHDPGLSTAQGELRANGIALTTGFAPADVEVLLPAMALRSAKWGPAEFEAARPHLAALAPRLWEVRAGGVAVAPLDARVELLPGDNVSFHLLLAPAPGATKLTMRAAKLAELPAGHRQFAVISDEGGTVIAKKLLSARDCVLEVPLLVGVREPMSASDRAAGLAAAGDKVGELPSALGFIWLGIEHIWTGYDHLLFLFALLVVCRSFRSILAIVTFFTLAHSLTLALATLGFVNLSTRLVEPLIAGSIVFVGIENLVCRGEEPKGRWALTFAFGLIHGFGFASVLRNLGVGGSGSGILIPLFTFNLGVEVGQVAIAAVVLPVVWQLRKKPQFLARGVPALSSIVTAAGVYWLVERTLFR